MFKPLFIAAVVFVITVSAQTPPVTVTQPLTGFSLPAGEPYTIAWVNPVEPTISQIWLAQGTTTTLTKVRLIAQNVPTAPLLYTWNVDPALPAGDYSLELGMAPNIAYAGPFSITSFVSSVNSYGSSIASASGSTASTSRSTALTSSSTALTSNSTASASSPTASTSSSTASASSSTASASSNANSADTSSGSIKVTTTGYGTSSTDSPAPSVNIPAIVGGTICATIVGIAVIASILYVAFIRPRRPTTDPHDHRQSQPFRLF